MSTEFIVELMEILKDAQRFRYRTDKMHPDKTPDEVRAEIDADMEANK